MNFELLGEKIDRWIWRILWNSWLTPILKWFSPPKPQVNATWKRVLEREVEVFLSRQLHLSGRIEIARDAEIEAADALRLSQSRLSDATIDAIRKSASI